MSITMVGTGYVGLVTGTCLASMGNDVTCLDIDKEKVQKLREGHCPIYEPGLPALIRENVQAGRLHFSTDRVPAYQGAELIFICVGTPSDERGEADLTAVYQCAKEIGQAMEEAPGPTGGTTDDTRPKIIVVKSTVPVGSNVKIRQAIASETSKPFLSASNPEFLKEGSALNDFNKPDRIILGADEPEAAERLRDLYEPFVRQGNPILVMDIRSAEMVKYASNTMLATKISFVNEIASLCEAYGADIDEVRRGMCSDQRIGNQFLYPGLGYGGSCFPKDVLACMSMGRHSQSPTPLMESVHEVNVAQRDRFVRKIEGHFSESLSGKRFGVWGLAFKPGTDDMREAPSVTIIEYLLKKGATVDAYDPVATDNTRQIFGDRISYHTNDMDAIEGADALIICTEWREFRHPDLTEVRSRMAQPVVFDGRNLFRLDLMRRHGFVYHSIGRPSVQPD
ncbi:MAG: UDP-glucose/GDP-mannose dehydrogenase family protein [Phycisphaerae bacterium]|nr:UDP-glucose/GDP-mannose dehydrogenase family protein [Phycisphaerae bacterium]